MKKVLLQLVYKEAESNANSACTWLLYVPKLPEKLKKLRKF